MKPDPGAGAVVRELEPNALIIVDSGRLGAWGRAVEMDAWGIDVVRDG